MRLDFRTAITPTNRCAKTLRWRAMSVNRANE